MNNGTQTPIVVICPLHTCPWVHVGYSTAGDDNTAAEVAGLVGIARTKLRDELMEHLKRQRLLAVSSGFGDQVRVDPAWRVDERVNVSLAA